MVFHSSQRILGQFFNVAEHGKFIGIAERQGNSLCARACRSADSMHVAFGFTGQLIIDDVGNPLDVNAAGHDIGGYQDFDTPSIEVRQRPLTCVLTLVGMNRIRGDAIFGEQLAQAIGPAFGACKDQGFADRLLL